MTSQLDNKTTISNSRIESAQVKGSFDIVILEHPNSDTMLENLQDAINRQLVVLLGKRIADKTSFSVSAPINTPFAGFVKFNVEFDGKLEEEPKDGR